MPNYNRLVLVGNLTREVQLRYTPEGTAVANTAIAVNRRHKSGEEVLFLDVTAWGRLAETVSEYLGKGSLVLVEGRLCLDRWEDREGRPRQRHFITADTVQFLDPPGERPGRRERDPADVDPPGPPPDWTGDDVPDDEIPF